MISKLCGICDGKLQDKIERKQPQTVKCYTQNRVKINVKIMKDYATQTFMTAMLGTVVLHLC